MTTRSVSVPAFSPAGFADVIRSEWTKLRSVRSTRWSAIALFVVMVGLAALVCLGVAATFDDMRPEQRAMFDPTATSLAGLGLGQLSLAVLGVMAMGSEYSVGGIRTTFIAVPRRLEVLAAKAVVVGVFALVTGTVAAVLAFLVGQSFLRTEDAAAAFGDPGVVRAVVGTGFYLAGSALFGLALGALFRSTPGGIAWTVAGLLVVPIVTALLPGPVGDAVQRFTTTNAGSQITAVRPPADMLGPFAGYAVFTLWWFSLLVLAGMLLRRRDA